MLPPDTWRRFYGQPPVQDQWHWPAQELDKIRLNLTSVDQFLTIACGLADNNPEIRSAIYEAARDAREAALLIDHLRSLFGRQLAQLDLQQHHREDGVAYGTSGRQNCCPPLSFHGRRTLNDENSLQFSYSNRLTLVRAAKSLVSNVAKVLYLTDLAALQCCRRSSNPLLLLSSSSSSLVESRQANQLNAALSNCHQSSYCSSSKSPYHMQPICQKSITELENNDRPDNVANYSQLLRSFGELSTELIDLGQCIMLATVQGRIRRRHGQANEETTATSSACEQSMRDDRQLGGHSPPVVDLPRRSPLDGSHQPDSLDNGGEGGDDDDDSLKGHWWYSVSKPHPSSRYHCYEELDSQLQDMQILFQVNRLIIDRSILLLLSASKCCLRQGSEAACGHQTRRSTVSQIRASISIIMAIVKRTVFGTSPLTSTESGAGLSGCFGHAQLLPELTSRWSLHSSSGETGNQKFSWQAALLDDCKRSEAGQKPTPLATFNGDKQQLLVNNGGGKNPEARQDEGGESGMPLQIMDFFLKSSTGAQSAHDAINRLQVLVKPLTQLVNHKCFIEALNKTLSRHLLGSLSQQTYAPYRSSRIESHLSRYSAAQREPNGCSYGPPSTKMAGDTKADQLDESANWWPGMQLETESCKENYSPGCPTTTTTTAATANNDNHLPSHPFADRLTSIQSCNIMLMNKQQLVQALNLLFLGELKSNLVERVHEFTDCAYTKHEHREAIVMLLQCIKLLLNKLVRSIYKSTTDRQSAQRRKFSSINADLSLGRVRLLASQLEETCAELKFQLQAVVIEQSNELDRCNSELDLVKQMKHLCLLGDLSMWSQASCQFMEQSEQLVEVCSMLNQVAPTNKMKINTKSLAIWFELNLDQLLAAAKSLCQNPRSQVLKDCVWVYFQVWCSFYDDFCQEACQLAYLMNAHCNPNRSARVVALRNRLLNCQRSNYDDEPLTVDYLLDEKFCLRDELASHSVSLLTPQDRSKLLDDGRTLDEDEELLLTGDEPGTLDANSLRSVVFASSPTSHEPNESPRSLDHYHGFGANYRRLHSSFQDDYEPEHSGQLRAAVHAHPSGLPMQPLSGRRLSAPFDANGRAYSLSTCDLNNEPFLSVGSAHLPLMAPPPPSPPPPPPPPTERHNIYADHHLHRVEQQMPLARLNQLDALPQQQHPAPMVRQSRQFAPSLMIPAPPAPQPPPQRRPPAGQQRPVEGSRVAESTENPTGASMLPTEASTELATTTQASGVPANVDANSTTDQQSTDQDKWSDSDADAIVRGAKETSQMAESMYQFIMGEGDLNTTQDLFTQAELFAEEANELYKEVRCFSYKVPAGELKKELLSKLSTIPVLVQQLQFVVKNPTVGEPAAIAKVDSVIRETRSLMEAVNRVVTATLSCRQHYNMAIASMRKRTRTLSPSYRGDKGLEFENHHHSSARHPSGMGSRHGGAGSGSTGAIGSEPDIWQYGRGPSSRRAVARSNTASSKTRVSFLLF